MKRYFLLALLALPVLPALGLIEKDSRATAGATAVIPDLSAKEKTIALKLTSQLLAKAVNFRDNGSAASLARSPEGETKIEWNELVVRQIVHGTVSAEDRDKGVSRRFHVQLDATAFRFSKPGSEAWSAWLPGQCPFFPASILVEEIGGRFIASAADLKRFAPGPELTQDLPDSNLMPHERLVAQR